jgi:hypothetical protein
MGMRVNANEQENPSPILTKRDWAATKTRGRDGHQGRKEAAHSWKRREREEEKRRKGKRKEDTRTGKEGERGAPEKADNPPLVQREM